MHVAQCAEGLTPPGLNLALPPSSTENPSIWSSSLYFSQTPFPFDKTFPTTSPREIPAKH